MNRFKKIRIIKLKDNLRNKSYIIKISYLVGYEITDICKFVTNSVLFGRDWVLVTVRLGVFLMGRNTFLIQKKRLRVNSVSAYSNKQSFGDWKFYCNLFAELKNEFRIFPSITVFSDNIFKYWFYEILCLFL